MMKKQLGLVVLMTAMSVFAVSANGTGEAVTTTGTVATGTVATGTVATGAVATGAVATGAVATGTVATGTVATGTVATGTVATGTVATGTVATGTVATGTVATGTVATGAVATGSVVSTTQKIAHIHALLDAYFAKHEKKLVAEKKVIITGLKNVLELAASKLEKAYDHLKVDYDFVISALESYKI